MTEEYPTIYYDEKARIWRGFVEFGDMRQHIGVHDTKESAIKKYEQINNNREFYLKEFSKRRKPTSFKKSEYLKLKEPKNHTAVKELLKRRKELEIDIAKIDADISVLNQENLTNKEGVYWNKDAINTMILQLDEGNDWVDTPLGSANILDLKRGVFFVPYACKDDSIVEHSTRLSGVSKKVISVEGCTYHPNASTRGKRVLLDVLIVEQNIGRYLTKQEVVYHIDGDELNNQIDNLMLFDNLKAKSFYLGLKDLDGRGITREVFEETMSTSSNCVSTCAIKLNTTPKTLHKYYPDVCNKPRLINNPPLKGGDLEDCKYAITEMFRLKIDNSGEPATREDLFSLEREILKICNEFKMPQKQYDSVIKDKFDNQLNYLTSVKESVIEAVDDTPESTYNLKEVATLVDYVQGCTKSATKLQVDKNKDILANYLGDTKMIDSLAIIDSYIYQKDMSEDEAQVADDKYNELIETYPELDKVDILIGDCEENQLFD